MSKPILVLGDVVLDRHYYGQCNRISPERPVPVINIGPGDVITTLGCAANVAAHISAAEEKCILMFKAATYSDYSYNEFYAKCCEREIETIPLCMSNLLITVNIKERIWAGQQQVCRIDKEDVEKPDKTTESAWIKHIISTIKTRDVGCVIFSDYDKGTLTDNIIQNVAHFCKNKDIPTVLDPKRPTYYNIKGLTIVKPNLREIKITNKDQIFISEELGETYLVNTLAKDGVAVYQNGVGLFRMTTLAQPDDVKDVCGLGDSVCALLGLSLFYKLDIFQAVRAANKAASIGIRHIGTYALSEKEIEECIGYATTS